MVDPQTVDWSQVSASNFPYKIRQESGDGNVAIRTTQLTAGEVDQVRGAALVHIDLELGPA